jgi:hypothetical protein
VSRITVVVDDKLIERAMALYGLHTLELEGIGGEGDIRGDVSVPRR